MASRLTGLLTGAAFLVSGAAAALMLGSPPGERGAGASEDTDGVPAIRAPVLLRTCGMLRGHQVRQRLQRMKINFTKKEYRTLVEMLLIADWVINAHDVEETESKKPFKELRKKVLAHHKAMGMADEFTYSAEHDDYFETLEYENRAPHMRFIDAHDDAMFWEGLARRLAHRDLAAEETLRPDGSYEGEEGAMRLFEIMTQYEDELAERGFDAIRFVGEAPQTH